MNQSSQLFIGSKTLNNSTTPGPCVLVNNIVGSSYRRDLPYGKKDSHNLCQTYLKNRIMRPLGKDQRAFVLAGEDSHTEKIVNSSPLNLEMSTPNFVRHWKTASITLIVQDIGNPEDYNVLSVACSIAQKEHKKSLVDSSPIKPAYKVNKLVSLDEYHKLQLRTKHLVEISRRDPTLYEKYCEMYYPRHVCSSFVS